MAWAGLPAHRGPETPSARHRVPHSNSPGPHRGLEPRTVRHSAHLGTRSGVSFVLGAGPLQLWLGPVFRPTEGRKPPPPRHRVPHSNSSGPHRALEPRTARHSAHLGTRSGVSFALGAGPLQPWLGPVFRPTEGRKHPQPSTGSPTPHTPPESRHRFLRNRGRYRDTVHNVAGAVPGLASARIWWSLTGRFVRGRLPLPGHYFTQYGRNGRR